MVPRLTAIIRSRKIAVKRKRHKAKIKSPLKCIENCSMHSNGLKTHRPVKILHTAAIFSACIASYSFEARPPDSPFGTRHTLQKKDMCNVYALDFPSRTVIVQGNKSLRGRLPCWTCTRGGSCSYCSARAEVMLEEMGRGRQWCGLPASF